jgi:hypothetical protein
MAPEVVDPRGSQDGHDGAESEHERDEGIEHGSEVEGEADEHAGDEEEEGGADPSGHFGEDVHPYPALQLPVVVDAQGRHPAEDGAEHPAEFHQRIEEIGAHLLGNAVELQEDGGR